ncbi:DUF434 domain-containing protein [Planctomycetales bacterium 10988]|nr:DUF434 domain-containing protein [Planctomycetales bacterium 10988]
MSDSRKHRGPHPEDQKLFAEDQVPQLQEAVKDLAWLFNRGYASTSALKLVGDRYELLARQRTAVARCTCTDAAAERRNQHQLTLSELAGCEVWIDGYNVLTSIEAALSRGVILHARDGCYRDMASMHGSYRKVSETIPALHLLGEMLAAGGVSQCHWLLDSPVSNSGRLKTILQGIAEGRRWNWETTLVPDPDQELMASDEIVISSDSLILDHAQRWFNLVRHTIDQRISDAWIVHLDWDSIEV